MRLRERFGQVPDHIAENCIWIHAVSVGETVACVPLVSGLQRRYPNHRILVTTMTPTGSDQVRRSFGDKVDHCYLPFDLSWAMRGFIQRVKPRMCVIMETELWPNMVAECARNNIPCALVNARLSERSARGYARFPQLIRPMLEGLSIVAAQSKESGDRFLALGLDTERLHIGGSIKFDCILDDVVQKRAARLRKQWQAGVNRQIWIAASTHEGEEEVVLDAHETLLKADPQRLLVLVPRHPQRFAAVHKLCKSRGLNIALRSDSASYGPKTQVLLIDTMGELNLLYGACDVAFVGGSIVPRGGHNPIEPAAWGLPIVCGTNTFNFAEISSMLDGAGGQHCVTDASQLSGQVERLLSDVEQAMSHGAANRALVDQNRGAVERQLLILDELISDAA